MRKEKKERRRLNAPPISWRVLLTTLGIVALLMFGESMIVSYMQDHLPAMISFLAHYCLLFCAVLAAAFILYRRRIYVQPLSAVAQAARRVAQGDLSVRLSPIRKDGRRDEVEALIEDFNTMVEELQSVEMLKTDFISSVSHEFKSPLAVIQSYAAALKDETLSPAERRDCADAVIDASRRLSGMVGNILRLSKMEQQQSPPPGKPYQLGEQLRRCALEQMDAWQEKGIDFAVDVADVLVCHDEGMLETVWNNLIGNAVKFSPPGGRIELTSRAEGESVLVSIRDHGCGMTLETQKRIFDKFYQGDPLARHAGQRAGAGHRQARAGTGGRFHRRHKCAGRGFHLHGDAAARGQRAPERSGGRTAGRGGAPARFHISLTYIGKAANTPPVCCIRAREGRGETCGRCSLWTIRRLLSSSSPYRGGRRCRLLHLQEVQGQQVSANMPDGAASPSGICCLEGEEYEVEGHGLCIPPPLAGHIAFARRTLGRVWHPRGVGLTFRNTPP